MYKCCIPEIVDLISDDENDEVENVEENNNNVPAVVVLSNEVINPGPSAQLIIPAELSNQQLSPFYPLMRLTPQRPQNIDSPGFSSDASTATDHGRRNLIDHIVQRQLSAQSVQEPFEETKTKECFVAVKKLTEEEIDKYRSKSPEMSSSNESVESSPNTPPSSSKSESPGTSSETSNKKRRIEVVKCESKPSKKSPIASLGFSRTQYEKKKKTKEIKRRMSKLVDSETDNDDENKKSTPTKPNVGKIPVSKSKNTKELEKRANGKKNFESAGPKVKNTAKDSEVPLDPFPSTSKSSKSNEKQLKIVHRRKTVDSRNQASTTEKKPKKERRKTIDGKTADQPTTFPKSTNVNNGQKINLDPSVTRTNKRSRNESNESEATEPSAKIARPTLVQPSTSAASKETYEFPSLHNSTKNVSGHINSTRPRHQSMYIDCPDEAVRSNEACVRKTHKEIRKRMKSVGERPHQPFIRKIPEDTKQKLKELTQNKMQQKQSSEHKEIEKDHNEEKAKAQKSSTVKVKKLFSRK